MAAVTTTASAVVKRARGGGGESTGEGAGVLTLTTTNKAPHVDVATTTTTTTSETAASEDPNELFADTVTRLKEAGMPHARQLAKELLLFLRTKVRLNDVDVGELSPPKQVKAAWRAVILDTKLYARICAALGSFAHHRPSSSSRSGVRKYVKAVGFDWHDALDEAWSEKRPVMALAGDQTAEELLRDARVTESDRDKISLEVRDYEGEVMHFWVLRTTRMGKVLAECATRRGVGCASLRLVLDGRSVTAEETPAELGLEHGDKLEVVRQLTGC